MGTSSIKVIKTTIETGGVYCYVWGEFVDGKNPESKGDEYFLELTLKEDEDDGGETFYLNNMRELVDIRDTINEFFQEVQESGFEVYKEE